MTESEQHLESSRRIKPGRRPGLRILRWVLGLVLTLAVLSGLGLGALYLRLQSGPLSFAGLSGRVVAVLSGYFAPDWKVTLAESALELDRGSFALRIRDLEIANGEGRIQLRAPNTIVSVDTLSLLLLRLHPRMIEFLDLQAIGSVNNDGSVTFIPAEEAAGSAAGASQEPEKVPVLDKAAGGTFGEPHGQSRLSQGVEAFFDIVAGNGGPLGALDRAQLTNLRLILVDNQRRVRARFDRIDATFVRTAGGGRTFATMLNGARGAWNLKGDIRPIERGYQLVFNGEDVPVQDLLFLSGLSNLPLTTSLKVSSRVEASLSNGVLNRLDGTFNTGEGRIDVQDKDATPLFVNSSVFALSWDEAARQMEIKQLEFEADGTHFRMTGDASMRPGEPWHVRLAANDAVLNGVAPGDKPVAVDRLEAEITGNGVITLDRLYLKGPNLNATIKAQYGNGSDPKAIEAEAEFEDTLMRSVLRLWPEITASGPRRYLVSNLRSGKAGKGLVKVKLSGDQVKEAMNGGSIPDDALLVDLTVTEGEFLPVEGLPALTKADVKARVTGHSAALSGKGVVVTLPDGRSLKVPNITFDIGNFWPADANGAILADVEGGADALASFLKLPKIKEAFNWDVSPEDIHGKAALKLGISLAINNVPKFADLPVSVEGRLSDITLNKAIGAEKLEKAAFSVSYKTGSLTIKGEGQLAGYPASISVSHPPVGQGTAVVLFSLDDAARTRRGMDFGNQLTGVIPLKVTALIGKGENESYQVEADLAKAAINNLLPGWTKPAGRAGKLTLSAVRAGDAIDVSDMRLEAGNVRLAGKARLGKEGAFESADLSSFQLSQGDDIQVKVDKANDVFRAVMRGNLGDARPVIRALTDSGGSTRAASGSKGGLSLDLDIALNILTGFNNESLTKSLIKAAIRNGSLRQLQLSGRLGSVNISAQTTTKNGAVQLGLQADNAGAFLRYLDIYRRMYGGDMFFDMMLGDGPQAGYVMLRRFTIRNEPALKQIVPSQTQGSGDRRIDVNEAAFTKARLDFVRNGSRVDFREGAIWGTHVGFTLDGYLDFARTRLDIAGTFVPAYGLNNAFAQLPILGPILGGGGQYGGLFGVNFRLTGAIGSPDVTVNPLSAVAPGIFRKLFGAGGPDAPVMPPEVDRR